MNKAEIRKQYIAKRKTLSRDEVLSFSKGIFEQFLSYFGNLDLQKVHLFLSVEKFNEVETKLFIDYFLEKGARVFVPKMIGSKLIALELTQETALEKNSWGILEPVGTRDSGVYDFDIVLTPLLYADSKGNRVGYGKGFYDGFFSSISQKTLKVGIGFFTPKEEVDDLNEFDVPLDYLVTPTEVLSFTGS